MANRLLTALEKAEFRAALDRISAPYRPPPTAKEPVRCSSCGRPFREKHDAFRRLAAARWVQAVAVAGILTAFLTTAGGWAPFEALASTLAVFALLMWVARAFFR